MNKVFTDIADVFKQNRNKASQLIVINLVVFFSLTLLRFGIRLFSKATNWVSIFDQNTLANGQFTEFIYHPWTLAFFPFTHAGLLDLLFNLILLYWFGNMLADFIGGRKMVTTYLVGSIFSIAFFMGLWGLFSFLNPALSYSGSLYGSSPGVYALMYAYVALNTESEMMPFGLRIKTRILVLAFLVISIFVNPALGVLDLGGAFFGYIQMKLLSNGINLTSFIERMTIFRKKKGQVIQFTPKNQVNKKPLKEIIRDENPSQEEIDFLLDKINKGGYGSLTNDEKNRLHKASQGAD